jgi:hypothetical protein
MYHILRSPTWLLVVCWQEGERVWRLSWPRHDLGWFDSPRVCMYFADNLDGGVGHDLLA